MNYKAMWEELRLYIEKQIKKTLIRQENCNPRKIIHYKQLQLRYEKVLEQMNELEDKHKYTL